MFCFVFCLGFVSWKKIIMMNEECQLDEKNLSTNLRNGETRKTNFWLDSILILYWPNFFFWCCRSILKTNVTVSAHLDKLQPFRLHLLTVYCSRAISLSESRPVWCQYMTPYDPKCLKATVCFVNWSLVIVSSVSYFYSFSCLFHLQLPLSFSRVFVQLV